MKKLVHNVETGEITEVALTKQEIEEQEAKDVAWLQEQKDKADAKALAESKLASLGLTVEDLKAVGLG